MYRYLYVDRSVLKKFGSSVEVMWMPMLLIKFPERGKDTYIVDCIFRDCVDSCYTSIFTLRKLPRNTVAVDAPPIEAKEISKPCSGSRLISDLIQVGEHLTKKDFSELNKFIDAVEEYSDVEITTRVFLRTRKYIIPAERLKSIDRKIALEVVKQALKKLHIYHEKENRVETPVVDFQPVYILMYIDKTADKVGLIVNKKDIALDIYKKFLKMQKCKDHVYS